MDTLTITPITLKQGATLSQPFRLLDAVTGQPKPLPGSVISAVIATSTGYAMPGVRVDTIDEGLALYELRAASGATALWPAGLLDVEITLTHADGTVEKSTTFTLELLKGVGT